MKPGPLVPAFESLADIWERDAANYRSIAAEGAARALERAAADLRAAIAAQAGEVLTLNQAAKESGYSAEHLRHLVADGKVPNAGRRGSPRVKRDDLPRKPGNIDTSTYNPDADALRIVSGAR